MKRGTAAEGDADWGLVPSESKVRARLEAREPQRRRRRRAPRAAPPPSRPTTRLRAAVPRLDGGQGRAARRHRRLPQRDLAVPQPVGVPARGNARREPDEPTNFKERIRPMLREQLGRGPAPTSCSSPQVVYGYWPCNGDGNDLVIWADVDRTAEGTSFSLPPATKDPWLCIADFFRPVDSGEIDYVAFMIVTMGHAVSERTAELFADEYQDYLLLHGLGVEMAEALAEYWHHRIREELGFADQDGPTGRACSASSTAAAATRGATRPAPTSRTTSRSPSCSAPSASASRSARRPGSSTSPSRPRRPSSATTPRPSTSSPGRTGPPIWRAPMHPCGAATHAEAEVAIGSAQSLARALSARAVSAASPLASGA